jgi:magnesium-transporting ATPase (P-type)
MDRDGVLQYMQGDPLGTASVVGDRMSGLKILAWIFCGIVGTVGITIHFYLNLRLWLSNARGEPPPANTADYLWGATASMVAACSAAYVALLVYNWKAIEFFWLFVVLTMFVLSVTVVPTIYTHFFSAAHMPRTGNNDIQGGTGGSASSTDEL